MDAVIKVVVFDLYGTLMTSEKGLESKDEALSLILREAGHEIYYQEVWSTRQFVAFLDYPRGRANTAREYYARVLERLEISPDAELIDKLVNKDAEIEKNLLYQDVPTNCQLVESPRNQNCNRHHNSLLAICASSQTKQG